VSTRVNLLGSPSVELDGRALAPPRGSKTWALLAYLALTDVPAPRSRLAGLLFEEADDPAAALRWSLSQLRKALRGVAEVGGDPVVLTPRPNTVFDIDVVARGSWAEALRLPGLDGELLEGVSPRVGATFDLWLSTERRRLAGQSAAVLREAAHARLAAGEAASAVDLAVRLVAAEPLVESSHELLVRALVAAGEPTAAAARVDECLELFERELGVKPSQAVSAALRHRPPPSTASTTAAVDAGIEGGVGAAHAGAYERSIELLRSAVDGARALGDEARLARSLVELGTVLVQGVRGSDEEAVAVLHEGIVLTRITGQSDIGARAALELGHVETLRAHYSRAEVWFTEATTLAAGDPGVLAWVELFRGMGGNDQGDYTGARPRLERAVELARSAGDARATAYALTALGRLQLLRGEPTALGTLDAACAAASAIGWTAFLPFPRALLAEVWLAAGDLGAAGTAFDHACALARQVGDPCWESYSLRGRGLVAAAQGADDLALELLVEAPTACRRTRDAHDWVEGHCLDALCRFAVSRGLAEAAGWFDELEEFAARRGLRELVARAALHRSALGQTGAANLVAVLVGDSGNPLLDSPMFGDGPATRSTGSQEPRGHLGR
jgi:DNA-binding SARP family transcriptional activator